MGTQISGQDLLDRIKVRLGGLSNAFTPDELLQFAEDGVQEVWAVLKSFDQEYFGDSSQSTDSAKTDSYFATLSTSSREYPLPGTCREIRSIECLTSGYERIEFVQKSFDDPEFQRARRNSTATGTSAQALSNRNYYFTVFGNKLVLAQYPCAVLDVKLWAIQSINAISVDTVLDTILYPFSGKIVDFAVKKAMVSARESDMTIAWTQEWRASIITLGESSTPRASVNAQFISNYLGE